MLRGLTAHTPVNEHTRGFKASPWVVQVSFVYSITIFLHLQYILAAFLLEFKHRRPTLK